MSSIQVKKFKKTLSVLKEDLIRRLNSLVLVSSQDRELVVTRTPFQSIATPYDSATLLKNQTPGLLLPRDSQLSLCSYCLEVGSIRSEVFFNPLASDPIKKPPGVPLIRNEQSLTQVSRIIDETAAEEEIVLRGQTLAYKLQTYLPEDIEEMMLMTKFISLK